MVMATDNNSKNAHKNAQESIHNVVGTGTNFTKNLAFYAAIGCVGFARYCGEGWHLQNVKLSFFLFSGLVRY